MSVLVPKGPYGSDGPHRANESDHPVAGRCHRRKGSIERVRRLAGADPPHVRCGTDDRRAQRRAGRRALAPGRPGRSRGRRRGGDGRRRRARGARHPARPGVPPMARDGARARPSIDRLERAWAGHRSSAPGRRSAATELPLHPAMDVSRNPWPEWSPRGLAAPQHRSSPPGVGARQPKSMQGVTIVDRAPPRTSRDRPCPTRRPLAQRE